MNEVKSGWRTTEFWMTIIATLAAAAVAVLPSESKTAQFAAVIVGGMAALGYTVSRSTVKTKALKQDQQSQNKIK